MVASILVVLLAFTATTAAAPCLTTCECRVGAALTTGVGNTPSLQNYRTTTDLNGACSCCNIAVVDTLDEFGDPFVFQPVATDGPYDIEWRPGYGNDTLVVCHNKPLFFRGNTISSIAHFHVEECTTPADACTSTAEKALVHIQGAVTTQIPANEVNVTGLTIRGTPGGSCTNGIWASCHGTLELAYTTFHTISESAIIQTDPGTGVCLNAAPMDIVVRDNYLESVGGGDADRPAIDLRGRDSLRATPLPFVRAENNTIVARMLSGLNVTTGIAFGAFRSTPQFALANVVTDDLFQVAIRLRPALGWVWDAGQPRFPTTDTNPRALLRQVAVDNPYALASMHDIRFGESTSDIGALPETECTDICPDSPYQIQITNATLDHNANKEFEITVQPGQEYTFEVVFETTCSGTPVLQFDASASKTNLLDLDTCASRAATETSDEPECLLRDPGTFNSNNWTVTQLAAQLPDHPYRWKFVRTFDLLEISQCHKLNQENATLVNVTTDNDGYVMYSGHLCLSAIRCNNGTTKDIEYCHYQCTAFTLRVESIGAVTATVRTDIIDFNVFPVSSTCGAPVPPQGRQPFTLTYETLVEHPHPHPTGQLRNAQVLPGLNSLYAINDTTVPCTGLNSEPDRYCHQVWTLVSLSPHLLSYVNSIHVQYDYYINNTATQMDPPFIVNLHVNVTCPPGVNVTDSITADMDLFRDTPLQVPYAGPSDYPFFVPSAPTVCGRVQANVGPALVNTSEIIQHLIVVCIATSGPLLPYNPHYPDQTGCLTPDVGAMSFVIYDSVNGNITLPDTYNTVIYRNPGQPLSEQNFCFNATRFLSNTRCALVQSFFHIIPTPNAPNPLPPPPPPPPPFHYALVGNVHHVSHMHTARASWMRDTNYHGSGYLLPLARSQVLARAHGASPSIYTSPLTHPQQIVAREFCVRCEPGFNATMLVNETLPTCVAADVPTPPNLLTQEGESSNFLPHLGWLVPLGILACIAPWIVCCMRRRETNVHETQVHKELVSGTDNYALEAVRGSAEQKGKLNLGLTLNGLRMHAHKE